MIDPSAPTSVPPSPLPPPPGPALHPTARRAESVARASVALVGLGGALLAARAVDVHAPACPFRTITGIACPGCGMTRLAAAVVGGDLDVAWSRDPAGVGFLVLVAVLAVASAGFVVFKRGHPPRWLGARALMAALVGLMAVHWVTTLVWGGMLTT